MEYKWNEKELKEELKRNKAIGNGWNISLYQEMIGILHNQYNPNEAECFNGTDTYKTMRDRFFYHAELLSPDMINYLGTIFTILPTEEKVLSSVALKQFDLTNDELITLVYDILKTLDDKYVLKVYNEFIKNNNKYLNI